MFSGNDTATGYEFLRLEPCPRLLEDAPLPRTQEALIADLPPQLLRTIVLPERPIGNIAGRQLRRQAQLYAATEHFEVPFTNMKVGSYAINLCPNGAEVPYGFKLKIGQQKYSPWLYFIKCMSINVAQKVVTWRYLQPMSFTGTVGNRLLAIQKAGQDRTWVEDAESEQTSEYCQDEMVLSWDLAEGSEFSGIPTEQYNQCKVVLTAMENLTDIQDEPVTQTA